MKIAQCVLRSVFMPESKLLSKNNAFEIGILDQPYAFSKSLPKFVARGNWLFPLGQLFFLSETSKVAIVNAVIRTGEGDFIEV